MPPTGYGAALDSAGVLISGSLSGLALLVAAPVIGSFLGVVIERLPEGRPIVWARSQCDVCGIRLAPRDLVPLISWLRTGGRCRHCGARLGWFHPAIELAALAVAVIELSLDPLPRALFGCLLGWSLLALAAIDLRRWLLPDVLTLPLLLAGLAVTAVLTPDALFDHGVAAAFGYLALRFIGRVYRGVRRREGLGGGDAKLLAAAGAWVGVAALTQLLLLAALTGLAAALLLRLRGVAMSRYSALPFGPFLALATWILWLTGPLRI